MVASKGGPYLDDGLAVDDGTVRGTGLVAGLHAGEARRGVGHIELADVRQQTEVARRFHCLRYLLQKQTKYIFISIHKPN